MAVVCRLRPFCRGVKLCSRLKDYSVRRYLLTDAYLCRDVWNERLESPVLKQVQFSDFIIQLQEKFEKEGKGSLVDIDIMVNKLHEMAESEIEIVEDLLYRFCHSPDARHVPDSIPYSIVRGYVDLEMTDRLIHMMNKKLEYGIFPDFYSANILMDHLIKKNDFENAANVAYEMMLQEDFSHRATSLLSLYACVKYLISLPAPEQQELVEEEHNPEDEDWVRVLYVTEPYYDDHFDIKDKRFLLGKTLAMLGKQHDDVMGRSLMVIGMGLHEKFVMGLELLEAFMSQHPQSAVVEEALMRFHECLCTTGTRDPTKPPKDVGLMTMDDEILKLKLTPDEKAKCLEKFKNLSEEMRKSGSITDKRLDLLVEEAVMRELPSLELEDIGAQQRKMEQWNHKRQVALEEQVKAYIAQEKKKEIEQRLKELQKKEEMLKFFDLEDEIKLAIFRAPREWPIDKNRKDDLERMKQSKNLQKEKWKSYKSWYKPQKQR